ncbi:TonB-linked SusC/RagA family outer membrane protein [Arenibacter sp. ARW7G5Y1]|nr:TonB-linked SusC/RagA family outer membrane protein [Arenibacter sp. ARW7G5Y1]
MEIKFTCARFLFKKRLLMNIMRTFLFLFFTTIYALTPENVVSQNSRIKIESDKTLSVDEVFKLIMNQTDYKFFYEKGIFSEFPKVNVKKGIVRTNKLLKRCLSQGNLDITVTDDNAVVIKEKIIEPRITNRAVQQLKISGTITDTKGEPLAGAGILEKGTLNGTQTDFDGNFSLDVQDGNAILIISYIGFASKEIAVGGQTNISVTLEESASELDEVVVVGFGTQKKVNLTGSVAHVSAAELTNRPVSNVQNLLQGKVPGLQIVQGSGQPGKESSTMLIRGLGTFSGAGNTPLVLVDGVQGNLSQLNPDNIESVAVLKDAASAAIYGARAANGVILVTTKTGKSGQLNISYHGNTQIQQATRMPDFVTNSADFMSLWNQVRVRRGLTEHFTQGEIDAFRNNVGNPNYPNTDWLDLMVHSATAQNHHLSVNGGNEKTRYNFGLGYFDQDGIIDGHDYQKYDLRLNVNSKINDVVSFGANVGASQRNITEPSLVDDDLILIIYAAGPNYSPYLPDGSGNYVSRYNSRAGHNRNPVSLTKEGGHKESIYALNAQAFLNINLTPNLIWHTKGAINFDHSFYKSHNYSVPHYRFSDGEFEHDGWPVNKGVYDSNNTSVLTTLYSTLEFTKTFGRDHNFKLLGAYNQESYFSRYLQGGRLDFPTPSIKEINAGSTEGQYVRGSASEWAIQSLFGRVNYDYKGKYLIEAVARYDGTSRIHEDTRWGVFPSVSAGWRLSEEAFMKDRNWLDNLKFRASWGQLGNQNIGLYPYQELMSLTGYPYSSTVQQGAYVSRLTDKNLKWETTTTLNFGLDLSIQNGLFSATADWFNKETTDILYGAVIPASVGLSAPTINYAAMRNKGFEIDLGHRNNIGELNYSVNVNWSTYNNEVTKVRTPSYGSTTIQEGLPWNSFYMIEWIGIFQDEADIASSPTHPYDPQPGDLKFRDVSGPDGVPDGKITADDRVVVDGAHPDFYYSGTLNLEWRNFDLSAFFQGVEGNKHYVNGWGIDPFVQGTAPRKSQVENAWTPGSGINDYPALYESGYGPVTGTTSTFFLQDASYFRLKNLSLGYNLPKQYVNKVGMKNLRLYLSGDNLFTITKYPAVDPERTGGGRFAAYPQLTIFSVGLKVNF